MTILKESLNTSDFDDTLSRIKGKKGVVGVIILKSDCLTPLISTFDKKTSRQYTESIKEIVRCASVFGAHGSNGVQLIRLHFKGQIVLIAPDKNFTFLAVQDTNI
ncbi:dynein-associated protein roadblock [Cryptosporidium canis]|uniref:Dynein-associated protein roadblock n=1 Tax=Cryptosporidium canis TaxID=195482 RepID=A0ABQ8P6T5_9CRYT|nr:dynein-associated protein roadblock [Cryptosporidium canis]KAJ1610864.1 dynein-associated protein roadblock [Cryptosporidium canis]